jgi:phage-related protein
VVTGLPTAQKPVEFMGSARRDLGGLPRHVRFVFGYAILLAQTGRKHPDAKPLRGFGGAGVLEVVKDFDRDTYRVAYTVKFEGVVYVLDAFQKKSKKGKATPKADIDRIKMRLKAAQEHYEQHYRKRISRTG